jgi:membrane-associated phospholipid phosphatase
MALIFAGTAWLLSAPRLITAFALVFLTLGLVNYLLSSFMKVSIHSEGVTLLVLMGVLAVSVNLLLLALLIPLVVWARVYLKAHDISEVSIGVFIAILAVYIVFSYFGLATF